MFLRWITTGRRSCSQALFVASTRPGYAIKVTSWLRAHRAARAALDVAHYWKISAVPVAR